MQRRKSHIGSENVVTLVKASESGVIHRRHLNRHWRKADKAIQDAKALGQIATVEELIFDPERLDKDSAKKLAQNNGATTGLPNFASLLYEALAAPDAPPALFEQDLCDRIGNYFSMDLVERSRLAEAGIGRFEIKLFQPYGIWYYLKTADYDTAYGYALAEAEKRHDEDWGRIFQWAGDELREFTSDGETIRARALARLYTRAQAEVVMDVSQRVFRMLMNRSLLSHRRCPDGVQRIPAHEVHALRHNREKLLTMEDDLDISLNQIRLVTDLKASYIKTLLHNKGVKALSQDYHKNTAWYRWGDVHRVFWPDGDHPLMADIEAVEESNGSGKRELWSDMIIELHKDVAEKRRRQREAKERRREEQRQQREVLRAQMIDNFPSWMRDEDVEQIAYLHVGPTNSGKTHDALVELANAGSGWYLAPLRLLARENFERLNRMGVYCSLLTGEERIDVPGATFTSATVEMFNPHHSGNCVVVDEAHMIADDQRGWAWTQALVKSEAPTLHVITAPHGLNLLTKIFDNMGVETQTLYHQRLVPLSIAPEHWPLRKLPERTILIAFTRRDVLRLKYTLQNFGRTVSVVYGALPPEVRLKQAERFANGEVEICVATDAVGMGLNLPADNVVFTTLHKYDGKQRRRITASELQQIGGRAGRYGLSEAGLVGGVDKPTLETIRRLINEKVPDLTVARLAPRTDEIDLLEGDLAQRLLTWQQLNAIPDSLRHILTSTDMVDRLELAKLLSYDDLMKLGVEKALLLVSAPVRTESQEYWVECATSILKDDPLAPPPPSPKVISEGDSLRYAEEVISCIDVYLWLAYREPFQHLVEDPTPVIKQREALTYEMDLALMKRFNPTSGNRRFASDDPWFDYF